MKYAVGIRRPNLAITYIYAKVKKTTARSASHYLWATQESEIGWFEIDVATRYLKYLHEDMENLVFIVSEDEYAINSVFES